MSVPGTVLAASIVAVISAVIALFFPPWGWLWVIGYVVAAFGLYQLQAWAYWGLLVLSVIGWIGTAMQGRFDVISTGIVIIILLLTPSARSAFHIGKYASTVDSDGAGDL